MHAVLGNVKRCILKQSCPYARVSAECIDAMNPPRNYMWQVLAITQGSGSVALSYVNFPVKVVMKSCKLIPTMALGIFILRRSYSVTEYSAAGSSLC